MNKPLHRYAGTIKRDWEEMPKHVRDVVNEFYNYDQIHEKGAKALVRRFLTYCEDWGGVIAERTVGELRRLVENKKKGEQS